MFDETPTTTTGHDDTLGRAVPLPPAVARAEVAREIRGFLQETVSWHAQAAADRTDPPVLGLKVTAGTGKTRETLRALAKAAPLLLIRGPVIYHAPTLALAREAFATFRELAPHVPAAVVAGRSAIVDGVPLCNRIEELAGLGEMVSSFQESVCKRYEDGRMVFAKCFSGCRYQAQFREEPQVVFTSHAYLRWQLPLQGTISLRIIDEAFWSTLHSSPILLMDAWLTGPTPKSVAERLRDDWVREQAEQTGAARKFWETEGPTATDHGKCARVGEARFLVVDALREGRSPIAALQKAGIDRDLVDAFGEWEIRDLPAAGVRLEQYPRLQAEIIRAFDPAERKAMLLRAKVWQLIAADFETGDTGRLSWVPLKPCPETGQPRHAIGLHLRHDLPLDAPVLMIDADLSPLIVGAYAPSTRFLRVDAEQTAEVVQISDRTMSTSWLLDSEEGRGRRDLVRAIIADEFVSSSGPVLLAATKKVLRALHQDIVISDNHPVRRRQPSWPLAPVGGRA